MRASPGRGGCEGRIPAFSQASHHGLSGKQHQGVIWGWTHLEGQLVPEDQESRGLVEVGSLGLCLHIFATGMRVPKVSH